MATPRLEPIETSHEPMRLGHLEWLLDLEGLDPDARDGALLRAVRELPPGGGLYVLASGDAGSLLRTFEALATPPRWRIVYRAKGCFEAVIRGA